MYIITQFFNLDDKHINLGLKILKKYLTISNIKIIIFSDKPIHNDTSKIIVYNRRSRLKWKDVFKFIYDNKNINDNGCLITEPNYFFDLNNLGLNKNLKVQIFQHGIYCEKIEKIYNNNRFIFEDYQYLEMSVIEHKIKTAVICHLYYQDLFEEMIDKIKNLDNDIFNVDYYFTLTEDSSTIGQTKWLKDKIMKIFPKANIYVLPNKGLDIGPFLLTIGEIYKKNINYDYLIKIHTKKSIRTSGKYFGSKWRQNLLNILDKDKLSVIKEHINKNQYMIASNNWIISYDTDMLNFNSIQKLKNELNIKKGNEFVGGTMFWIKFSIIKKYLTMENILKYYEDLEEGYYFQNKKELEYLTHSFERLFGFMIKDSGQKIVGI